MGKTNYCTEKSRLKPATIYGLAKLNSENIIKKKLVSSQNINI